MRRGVCISSFAIFEPVAEPAAVVVVVVIVVGFFGYDDDYDNGKWLGVEPIRAADSFDNPGAAP
jgi:hypothetical protein